MARIEVRSLYKDEIADLDPGIRNVVIFLRDNGFETTDSGDGVTKDMSDGFENLSVPHVFMKVSPMHMISEARVLQSLFSKVAHKVEASYDPADDIAILSLYGVNDESIAPILRK